MVRYLIPLGVFLVIVVFLGLGLGLNPRDVPSPLIDKRAPEFVLKQLHDQQQTLSRDDMLGQVWLLNVWASWCVACLQEHPLLVEMQRRKLVPLVGLNYKDEHNDAVRWLRRHGDPYDTIAVDLDGKVGIDFGVYGVPETYVIDKQGVIRYKHTGPISPNALEKDILPLVRQLQQRT